MKLTLFIVLLVHSSLFASSIIECDPENAASFLKHCQGSSSASLEIPLWQGTDHPGHQLIDCQKRTIKNVINRSRESYSCQIPLDSRPPEKIVLPPSQSKPSKISHQ